MKIDCQAMIKKKIFKRLKIKIFKIKNIKNKFLYHLTTPRRIASGKIFLGSAAFFSARYSKMHRMQEKKISFSKHETLSSL
jgi:hypothetical protein